VFVHGALCVAYSGQCFTSRSIASGAPIAAVAPDLPHPIRADLRRRPVDLGGAKYLLSPQDLAAYDLLPELIAAGVNSLKIEGRMKSADYVANITRYYRRRSTPRWAAARAAYRDAGEEMEVSFLRGFSHGWLGGDDIRRWFPGSARPNAGVYLAKWCRFRSRRAGAAGHGSQTRRRPSSSRNRGENAEQGGRVYEVFRGGQSLTTPSHSAKSTLDLRPPTPLDLHAIRPGEEVGKPTIPR